MTSFIYKFWLKDAQRKFAHLQKYLKTTDQILEIGTGPGSLWETLDKNNFSVKGVDIKNTALKPQYAPKLYDGETLPFNNTSFNVAIIATVLHHCPKPERLLQEAKRVAHRVLVIEDIHRGWWHLPILKFTDSLVNNEWKGHPYQFRSEAQWKETFQQLSYRLIETIPFSLAYGFKQHLYALRS